MASVRVLRPSHLRLFTYVSLMLAAVLLVWPIYPPDPLWSLRQGWGFGPSPGGTRVVTPVSALVSGQSLGDGGDRWQLGMGLILTGLGIGAGLANAARGKAKRKLASKRSHGDDLLDLGDRAGLQP